MAFSTLGAFFGGFLFKVGFGAAPFLRSIRWQFAAVDGEHFFADQTQVIADEQDFPEQFGNLLVYSRYKIGNSRKVRLVS